MFCERVMIVDWYFGDFLRSERIMIVSEGISVVFKKGVSWVFLRLNT